MPNEIKSNDPEQSKPSDMVAQLIITALFVAIIVGIYKLFILVCDKAQIPVTERKNVGIFILVILFIAFYIVGLILKIEDYLI